MSGYQNTGFFRSRIVVTPTIQAAAYSSGNLIGGKLTLANAVRGAQDPGASASGMIDTIILTDKSNQKSAIDVVFFSADPTATTFTDRAAVAINAADLLNVAGRVSIATADYSSLAAATNAEATKGSLGIAYQIASGTSLFACLICRGTPTFVSTSDIQLAVLIRRD